MTHKSQVLKVHSCSAASYRYLRQCATPNVLGNVTAHFPPKTQSITFIQISEVKLLLWIPDPFLKAQDGHFPCQSAKNHIEETPTF